MTGVRAIAAAYGVRIDVTDLGDWGRVRLIAEYDPRGPVIRVNGRESPDDRRVVERAIAHELYHHREAIGEIARIGDRAAREAAADAYADALLRAESIPLNAASAR
jgi:hypothetical protein